MRAVSILALLLYIFVCAKCSSKAQEKKVMEPPLSMEKEDKEERSDFDLSDIMADCNETFRIEMSYIDALNTSGSFPDETDRTPKCFVRCVLEKSGVASDAGEFDAVRTAAVFAGMRSRAPLDVVRDMAGQCTDRSETCKCERSYQYMKCLIEKKIETEET